MEVTRKNFETVLTGLHEVFQNAQFIALDTEFTGLKVEGGSNINYFDTLEDLYLKDRLKAETFMALQFGIVAFFYEKETEKYTHQAYNFYIFPSSHTDVNFTCQNKSIEFLVQHGFDFNKVFKEGIPFVKDTEVDKLLSKLEEKFDKTQPLDNPIKIEIPPEHVTTISDIIKKVQEILQSNSKKCFTTERQNSFIRKLIYNSVQNEFGSKVFLESNKDETMLISVGFTSQELKEKQKKKFLMQKKEILDEVGFCKVIKLLIEFKKLIVGHNLLLDILFTIKQFLSPLPDSYSEFKELVHFLFPKIIDTKHMASTYEFKQIKDTSLYTLIEHFSGLKAIPEVEIKKDGEGYKMEDKKFHEAAYDAYLTGLCFITMAKCLGNINLNSNILSNLPESPILEPFMNKFSVPKLCDIFFMNVGGADNEPDRIGVYHLTFPKEWTRDNITTLFKDCGFINISWINSTSAFIKFKKEHISKVNKFMNTDSDYKLCTYSEFKKVNEDTSELSPLKEEKQDQSFRKSTNDSDSSFNFKSDGLAKKRKVLEEDIGEVIQRPPKKSCA